MASVHEIDDAKEKLEVFREALAKTGVESNRVLDQIQGELNLALREALFKAHINAPRAMEDKNAHR